MEARPDCVPGIVDAGHCALFLDVDGTLLGFEAHPDAVVADRYLRGLLDRLFRQLDGALALVSGRSIAALDRIFAPLQFPAAGAHGVELRVANGDRRRVAPHDLPRPVLDDIREFVRRHDGLLLEPKPAGASLHYRSAPELENECRRFVQALLDRLRSDEWRSDYRIIEGKMILELAPIAASKGDAIRTLMHEPPFAGRRPVFVGDDTTDEDGFRAVNDLGGTSVRVGHRDGSAAAYALEDIAAVRDWLAAATGKVAACDDKVGAGAES